jgi:NAD(P)-dependent dehydrogenase (short-subunit alcohol dehydrogenase family)
VFGPIAIIQALLPSFRAQGSGHILNISSVVAFATRATFGAYNSSKAALDAFSETLAQEVEPFGVRVHTIAPGLFLTNFMAPIKAHYNRQDTTGAYTTPEEGLSLMEGAISSLIASRQIGDPKKLAERLYEIVSGTGLAQGLMDNKDWVRIPLGPDSGAGMREKAAAISASVEAYEPIWKSTNLDSNDDGLKE